MLFCTVRNKAVHIICPVIGCSSNPSVPSALYMVYNLSNTGLWGCLCCVVPDSRLRIQVRSTSDQHCCYAWPTKAKQNSLVTQVLGPTDPLSNLDFLSEVSTHQTRLPTPGRASELHRHHWQRRLAGLVSGGTAPSCCTEYHCACPKPDAVAPLSTLPSTNSNK